MKDNLIKYIKKIIKGFIFGFILFIIYWIGFFNGEVQSPNAYFRERINKLEKAYIECINKLNKI